MEKSLGMSAKFEEKINRSEGTRLRCANDHSEDGIKGLKECRNAYIQT